MISVFRIQTNHLIAQSPINQHANLIIFRHKISEFLRTPDFITTGISVTQSAYYHFYSLFSEIIITKQKSGKLFFVQKR